MMEEKCPVCERRGVKSRIEKCEITGITYCLCGWNISK